LAKKAPKAIYVTDISDNNLKDLADDITKTTGVECIPRRVDAASEKDIQAVVSHALEHYGRLDVFFANAGIARHFVLAEAECEDFMEMMRVNAWRFVIK
jgi:NADP-dependent 3-hydroxy acid dehydrogenase YdfG